MFCPDWRTRRVASLVIAAAIALAGCMNQGRQSTTYVRSTGDAIVDQPAGARSWDGEFHDIIGNWAIIELGPGFPFAAPCVLAQTPVDLDRDDTAFIVSANRAQIYYRNGIDADANLLFVLEGGQVARLVRTHPNIAEFAPGDDFAVIATLADTPARFFGVSIVQPGVFDRLYFRVAGFRDAYAELGRICGFDTQLILGY